MPDFDIVVLGAGVVGLACAEVLAGEGKRARSVLVIERHASRAQETSSRNSGVVHAGIYYPPSSLKAELCVRGRALLTLRAQAGRIALRQIGKLIVASEDSELPALRALQQNAAASGVALSVLDGASTMRLEPALRVVGALHSKATCILDPLALADDLYQTALARGATFAFSTALVGLDQDGSGHWHLHTRGRDGTETTVTTGFLVNAAGLWADHVASLAGLDIDAVGLRQHFCKGDYFSLTPALRGLVSHLVYPVPDEAGLGIHLTLDLAGNLHAGPDAEYVDFPAYAVREDKRTAFATAIQRYLPAVRAEHLTPAYAGVRPKLAGPGAGFRDFVIRHEAERGLPGLINLLGIESPGLTASLAIAERVRTLVDLAA